VVDAFLNLADLLFGKLGNLSENLADWAILSWNGRSVELLRHFVDDTLSPAPNLIIDEVDVFLTVLELFELGLQLL